MNVNEKPIKEHCLNMYTIINWQAFSVKCILNRHNSFFLIATQIKKLNSVHYQVQVILLILYIDINVKTLHFLLQLTQQNCTWCPTSVIEIEMQLHPQDFQHYTQFCIFPIMKPSQQIASSLIFVLRISPTFHFLSTVNIHIMIW